MKPDIRQLIDDVRAWGVTKGITGPNGRGTLLGQLSKTQEELTETRDEAILMNANLESPDERDDAFRNFQKELGDIMVTIILAAELGDTDIETCLNAAYRKIKDRQGKMVDGQFVKEAQP